VAFYWIKSSVLSPHLRMSPSWLALGLPLDDQPATGWLWKEQPVGADRPGRGTLPFAVSRLRDSGILGLSNFPRLEGLERPRDTWNLSRPAVCFNAEHSLDGEFAT